MGTNVIGVKILDAIVDILTVEEIEAILAKKKEMAAKEDTLTETEILKEHYRKLMVEMGIIHPPSKEGKEK